MYRMMLSLIFLTAFITICRAQPVRFDKGDIDIKAGIGLFPTFAADKGKLLVPPLSVELGYHLTRNFSLSAYAAYSSTATDRIDQPGKTPVHYENDFIIVGLKGAGHAHPAEKWDIYGGFLIGYNMPQVSPDEALSDGDADPTIEGPSFTRPAGNNFTYSGFVGAGYFLSRRTGIFAEVGYGISLLNIGVHFKL